MATAKKDSESTEPGKMVTKVEEALEAGYFGSVPDPTPNEAYTVAGVTSSDQAAKADQAAAQSSPKKS